MSERYDGSDSAPPLVIGAEGREEREDVPSERTPRATVPLPAVVSQSTESHEHVLPDGSGSGRGDRGGLAAGDRVSDHGRTPFGAPSSLGSDGERWVGEVVLGWTHLLRDGLKGQVVTRPRVPADE
jgi:hypothetical protein